jgi:hypothetical protein
MTTVSHLKLLFEHASLHYFVFRSMPLEERVAQVIEWFSGDPSSFPNLVTLYFEEPDSTGHVVGPFGDEVIMFCRVSC